MARNNDENKVEAAPVVDPMAPVEAPNTEALPPAVATPEQNAALEHTDQDAPETTRHDALDLGVPMLPADPDAPREYQGPEDALGIGPKRGDYTARIGPANYHPHEAMRTQEGAALEPQRPRAEDIGEAPGLKGGVETDPRA